MGSHDPPPSASDIYISKPSCVCLYTGGSECSWDKERLTSPLAGAHSGGPGGGAGAPGAGGGGGAAGGGSGRGPAIAAVNQQQQLQQQQQQLLANSECTYLNGSKAHSLKSVVQVH